MIMATTTNHLSTDWGEPERAPRRRDKRSQSIYYVYYYLILYVWYVRHARTAIDIVQRCAVYFKRPHENICVSIVTCFFDTLNYFSRACIALIDQASYRTAPYRSKQKTPKEETLSEIEPVISSIAQGPAKNTIKID